MLLSLKHEKVFSQGSILQTLRYYLNISASGTQTKLQLRQGTESSGLLFTLLKM